MCGGGGGGGGGGRERRRGAAACDKGRGGGVRRRAAAACGGGVWLFSVTRDGTLRREMKIYFKDNNMSGHKFAERGGDVLQICVFMTDIHILGLKIGLKRHKFVSL